jgi:hypothetical protein
LKIAKKLLNPKDSVLIVTIDEKEYLHLGCLLEEMFPQARMQMVSSVINPKGQARNGLFGRTDEYLFFVMLGVAGSVNAQQTQEELDVTKQKVEENVMQSKIDNFFEKTGRPFIKGYKAVENAVVNGYKIVETSVVGGYQAVENSVVGAFNKIETSAENCGNSRRKMGDNSRQK